MTPCRLLLLLLAYQETPLQRRSREFWDDQKFTVARRIVNEALQQQEPPAVNPPATLSRSFRLDLVYDGSAFQGWQRQGSSRTVQQVVEDSLSEFANVRVAGRTDAGVHATGQVARYRSRKPMTAVEVMERLQSNRDSDWCCSRVTPVDRSFHPTFGATSRSYVYVVDAFDNYEKVSDQLNALWEPWIGAPKDYAVFCHGPPQSSAMCTLLACQAVSHPDSLHIHLTADRFLRRMIRKWVATSLECVLWDGEMDAGSRAAPPGGLIFTGATYE